MVAVDSREYMFVAVERYFRSDFCFAGFADSADSADFADFADSADFADVSYLECSASSILKTRMTPPSP
jgi:hypothetical protein